MEEGQIVRNRVQSNKFMSECEINKLIKQSVKGINIGINLWKACYIVNWSSQRSIIDNFVKTWQW